MLRFYFLSLLCCISCVARVNLHGVAQCARCTRNNGDFMYRCRMCLHRGNHSVTDFVISDYLFSSSETLFLFVALRQSRFDALFQIGSAYAGSVLSYSSQSGFIHDIGYFRTRCSRSSSCNQIESISTCFTFFRCTSKMAFRPSRSGSSICTAVKPSGTKQGFIKAFRTIGGSQNNHTFFPVKTVHFGKQLVQCLFSLIVGTHSVTFLPMASISSIKTIQGAFIGLTEQVAHWRHPFQRTSEQIRT